MSGIALTLAQTGDAPPQAQSVWQATVDHIIAPYMAIFFIAFFVAIIATPVVRKLAIKNGIIDWPDLRRKAHKEPVAYLGGVAIFVGWLAGVLGCFVITKEQVFPIQIILGAAAITLTGLFDDVYGIRARVKIGGQLFAAAALASVNLSGARGEVVGVQLMQSCLNVLGLGEAPYFLVYLAGTLLVAFLVLGGCNAVNLIDGLDGLASGVTAIAVTGFLFVAGMVALRHGGADGVAGGMWSSDVVRIALCLALLGAICGFLPYNFNPATIFMGDAGSLLLGFLAVSSILLFADVGSEAAAIAADPSIASLTGEERQAALKGVLNNPLKILTACLIIFAVPITDTSLAIIRRKVRGQPIFAPDAQHIHHLLRKRGLSVRRAVGVIYLMGLAFGTLGVLMVGMQLRWRYVLAVFAVLYGFIMVQAFKFGHQLLLQEKLEAQAAAAGEAAEPEPQPAEAPLPDEHHARDPVRREPADAEPDAEEDPAEDGPAEMAQSPSPDA